MKRVIAKRVIVKRVIVKKIIVNGLSGATFVSPDTVILLFSKLLSIIMGDWEVNNFTLAYPKGLSVLITLASPAAVIVNAFVLLSIIVLDWQVNRLVLAMAVNGDVGGVKSDVYTACPFIKRILLIDP